MKYSVENTKTTFTIGNTTLRLINSCDFYYYDDDKASDFAHIHHMIIGRSIRGIRPILNANLLRKDSHLPWSLEKEYHVLC